MHLADKLLSKGHQVVGLDSFSPSYGGDWSRLDCGTGRLAASCSFYDRRLTLQTLIRLGSPPAVAEAAFLSAGAPPEDIQRDLKQAQQRPKCTY
jgi:nucleoside-diphosphate-sugar epimerase